MEKPFNELKKIKISLKNAKEPECRKVQYDLMLLDEVLRVHAEAGAVTIIAIQKAGVKKLLSAIPSSLKPKVLKQEKLSYTELLKRTFSK